MEEDIIILIPAYNPNEILIKLVQELKKYKNKIVVVDDGSDEQKIFKQIKCECEIIHNEINQGKGMALKRGLEYILKKYTNLVGIITADADGQHLSSDIIKVKNELIKNKDSIILGIRNFEQKGVPIRNKLGNKIMNYIFKLKTGVILKDTQTGLRGFPYRYVKELINIDGKRFEYEINVLNYFANKTTIKEVKMRTIYTNDIKTNFKTLRDSINIILNFIRN